MKYFAQLLKTPMAFGVMIYCSFSANAQLFQKGVKTIATYEFIQYNPEYQEFYVQPEWWFQNKKLDKFTHAPVADEDMATWFKNFNKGDKDYRSSEMKEMLKGHEFEWVRNAFNDRHNVILRYKNTKPLPAQKTAIDMNSIVQMERLFIPDETLMQKLPSEALGILSVKAAYANASVITTNTGEIGSVQYFSDTGKTPVAYYRGELKNGRPNGNGVLVLNDFVQDEFKMVNGHQDEHHRFVNYNTKKGLWNAGKYMYDAETQQADQLISGWLKDWYMPAGYTGKIIAAEFYPDKLTPDLADNSFIRYRVLWEKDTAKHFMLVDVIFDDFTLENFHISLNYSSSDAGMQVSGYYVNLPASAFAKEKKEESGNAFFSGMLRLAANALDVPTASSYDVDEYARVETDGWHKYGTWEFCGYNNYKEYDVYAGNYVNRQVPLYLSVKEKNMLVKTKALRKNDWKESLRYIIREKQVSCNPDSYLYTVAEQGSNNKFKNSQYGSYTDAFNGMMADVKLQFPNPKKDTTLLRGTVLRNTLFEKMTQRLARSAYARKGSATSWEGVWKDSVNNAFYVIDTGGAVRTLSLETLNQEQKSTYNKAIDLSQMVWKNDRYFEIGIRNPKCSNCIADAHGFQVLKRTADKIWMEEDIIWTRIKPLNK